MTPRLRLLLVALAFAATAAQAGLEEGRAALERKDGKAALAQLKPLAQKGDAEAQNLMGRLYFYDVPGVPQNYPVSARWFRRAADQGHAAAQYKLGGMYFAGRGLPQDDRLAFKWWRLAAEQGHAECQNNLGALFANGRGVPRDMVFAYALQALALANGNELAADNLRAKEETMPPAEVEQAKALAKEMAQPGALKTILDRRLAEGR
jgi:TPR repeat protein